MITAAKKMDRPTRANALIKKEFFYKTSNPSITRVHIGFFPSTGRYFREEMQMAGKGVFELSVMLPRGKSFHHYFINGDFANPVNDEASTISKHDPQKRAPLVLETDVFCPVQFDNAINHICHITADLWEFRVITHQRWITQVSVVIDSVEYPFMVAYNNLNMTFWSVRLKLRAESIFFVIKFGDSEQQKYLHRNYVIGNHIDPASLFYFELVKQTHQHQEAFQSGYQIVPDRFSRLSGRPNEEIALWGSASTHYNHFGGNFKGIISKLTYLADMGVDFIYMTPVFLSKSYHRYDCLDYMKIDPLLGSEADFDELIFKAHALGIKIVLDISLNHCSKSFFAFQDVMEHQQASPYVDWFEIKQFPLTDGDTHYYNSWHGYEDLPQFNLHNKEVTAYFLGVMKYWTEKYNIDGWRLDVCTEMPVNFIQQIADQTRALNRSTLMIGEMWHDDATEYITKADLDGFTNFSFYLEVIAPFFIQEKLSLPKVALAIMHSTYKNSFRSTQSSWNFLCNHDLPRFYSVIKDKNKYCLAFALLYSLIGTPVLYYGEETCMEGFADPENRACMDFENKQEELFETIAALATIRKKYSQLFLNGMLSFPFISHKQKILVIQRSFEKCQLFFCINFSNGEQEFVLNTDKSACRVTLHAFSFNVVFKEHGNDGISTVFQSRTIRNL